MEKLKAYIKRWWHCLSRLHRPIDYWERDNGSILIACDCGKIFYKGGFFKHYEDDKIVEYAIKDFKVFEKEN